MRINFFPNDRGNIIEFDDDEKKDIKSHFLKSEKENGIDEFIIEDVKNNADNDDYLFLWYILHQNVVKAYEMQNVIRYPNIWRKNYRAVPYIHIEFKEFYSSYTFNNNTNMADIDDKKLAIRTYGPVKNEVGEYYIIYIDKLFLVEYMKFLANFFYYNNDNRAETIDFPFFTFEGNKPIFCTSGFKEYTRDKDRLICKILIYSFMAIFAHEFSHVSNAHLLLKANEKEYVADRDVSFCLESNADDNAIRLILSNLLYYGQRDTGDYNLRLTKKDFIEKWSLKSFSAFLALTWAYQGRERRWDSNTVNNYLKSISVEHPQYQIRAYNIINRAINHIFSILKEADTKYYRTKDGYPINEDTAKQIVSKTIDLIRSLDFCMYYYNMPDIDVIKNLFFNTDITKVQTHLTDSNALPIALLFNNEDAITLNNTIKQKWPEVKQKLQLYNPYCMLYKTI